MHQLFTLLLGTLLSASAFAQQPGDFTVWPDIVVDSSLASYTANGVGAPSVAYDSTRDRYLMVYETRLNSPTNPGSSCPVGTWGLGIASSTDPVTGWVAPATPLLEPTNGTFFACVAAHPTAMYDEASDQLIVWFKAESEGVDAADLSRYEGVGRIRVRFFPAGGVKNVLKDNNAVLSGNGITGSDLGFPRVINDGTNFIMALTVRPNTHMAKSATTTGFNINSTPALSVADFSAAGWANNELFNPTLLCETGAFKYTLYQGGRTILGGLIADAGWSRAISADAITWFADTSPFFQWSGGDDWRHWDALRVGTADYLVWYAEKDASGLLQIRFTSTTMSWNSVDVYNKKCP